MACDRLLKTKLFQVFKDNCQKLLSMGLLQVVSNSCNKSGWDKLQQDCGVFGYVLFLLFIYSSSQLLLAPPSCDGASSYRCKASTHCIDKTRVCNGLRECPNGDDEASNCGT